MLTATLKKSSGYTTSDDGSRVPSYTTTTVDVQVQALQYNDLQMVSGLNIQGERRAMYVYGAWNGAIRADNKGGDLITLSDGTIWLVVMVLEPWSSSAGWTKVCVVLQNGS